MPKQPQPERQQSGAFYGVAGMHLRFNQDIELAWRTVLNSVGQKISIKRITEKVNDEEDIVAVEETSVTPSVYAVVNEVTPDRFELLKAGYWHVGDLEINLPANVDVQQFDIIEWNGKRWRIDDVTRPLLINGKRCWLIVRAHKESNELESNVR